MKEIHDVIDGFHPKKWITFSFTNWFEIYLHPHHWLMIPSYNRDRYSDSIYTSLPLDSPLRDALDTMGLNRYASQDVYLTFLFFTIKIKFLNRTSAWYLIDREGKLKVEPESDRYFQLLNECI